MSTLFEECVHDIETEYARLGHTLGWRFLSVSQRVLDAPVRLALGTLNPAGDRIPPDHPWASCENGVSYLVERWRDSSIPGEAPLQVQVREMFRLLAQSMAYEGSYDQLMAESLIAHLIPFRSPRFANLHRKEESLALGRRLWTRILPQTAPRLIICLGRQAQRELRRLIPGAMRVCHASTRTFPTGWGNYTVDIDDFAGNDRAPRLLYLPHLSTWTLFTSAKCRTQMQVIMEAACQGP